MARYALYSLLRCVPLKAEVTLWREQRGFEARRSGLPLTAFTEAEMLSEYRLSPHAIDAACHTRR